MMGFFSRSRPVFSGHRFRPALEALEYRYCPSDTVAIAPPATSPIVFVGPLQSYPPTITLMVMMLDHRQVQLVGTVSDANPGGLTVQFSGQYSGSAVTDASGNFSVNVTAAGLGVIQATVTDRAGLASNIAQGSVTSPPPAITNFQAMCTYQHFYTFSGRVNEQSAAGLTVTFDGFPDLHGRTATVATGGTFSFTMELAPTDIGLAVANFTDWWGQVSPNVGTLVG